MQLPDSPQPVEIASNDKTIIVAVNAEGQPTGVQLEPPALELGGAELARRILILYELAKTVALALLNTEHHRHTGTWLDYWPTPEHVNRLELVLDF